MTYNAGAKTCTNTGGLCHGTGATPAWGTSGAACAACHYYPGATAGLLGAWAAGNGHQVRYDAPVVNTHLKASGYNFLTDNYSTVTRTANGACVLCHRNAKHRNGSGFAHLSSATGSTYSQCGATPFTFSSGGVGNDNNVTCNNVKCHSGKVTPIWK